MAPKTKRKSTRKPRKKSGKNLAEDERLIARQRAIIESQMTALEAEISEFDPSSGAQQGLRDKVTATTASLTKSLTAVSAEQRQLEKHTRQLLDDLSPEEEDAVVAEFLSSIPHTRRAAFVTLLASLEDTNDLLAL